MVSEGTSSGQPGGDVGTAPIGRRQPASGAERERRDAWAQTWAPAGREVAERLAQERVAAQAAGQ